MDVVTFLIDLFLHLDDHLSTVIAEYGTLTYLLPVSDHLPGDRDSDHPIPPGRFAALRRWDLRTSPALGAPLNIWLLFVLLCAAAIVGDTVNYWIGLLHRSKGLPG